MTTTEKIDIAILCPIQEEFKIALDLIQHPQTKYLGSSDISFQYGEFAGTGKKWKIGLFLTGQGIDRVATTTTLIISFAKPQFIFLLGIAGGIKDVKIGDVVICNKFYGYEGGRETDEGFKPRPEAGKPSKKIFRLAEQLVLKYGKKHKDHKVLVGPIASGFKLLAGSESETMRLIKRVYNDTLAVEREAIGFYEAARDSGVQFLNVRGISDLIDRKEETETDGSRPLAMKNAITYLSFLIEHLPSSPDSTSNNTSTPKNKPVLYLSKAFNTWMRIRRPASASIAFFNNQVVLKLDSGQDLEITQIKSIERYKMPGDLKASWVKLVFYRDQNEEVIFLSANTSLPGWGATLGGSGKLYSDLEDVFFKEPA